MSVESVLLKIKEGNVNLVRFEMTDLHGVARSKLVPVCHFEEKVKEGLGFIIFSVLGMGVVGDDVEGTGFGLEVGLPDSLTFPDLETFRVLPWLEQTARILIEPTLEGIPVAAYPRVMARMQLEKLESLGISLLSAHEYEFRIFDKGTMRPFCDDASELSTIRNTPINGLLNQIVRHLPEVGVSVETVHSEGGPGTVEVTYKPAYGIRSADNAHTYKTSIKEIALLNGYVASFMTKPLPGEYITECHFCHSLWDSKSGASLLFDENGAHGLTEVGQQWMAGLLAHAPATKVLAAPTVNCLESNCLTCCAPNNTTWGIDNRTSLVRVKVKGAKGTYFEHRLGTSACNPYIYLAAVVAAGIDGIAKKMELPPPVSGSAYRDENVPSGTAKLPTNMDDAIQALLDDRVICDALGEDFIKCFTAVKWHEARMGREAKAKGDADWQFRNFFYYL